MSATTVLIGNATADIELRYSQAGQAIGNLTIAVSDRVKNKQTGEWEDGNPWFARCTIWGDLAEHAAASIVKGMRVIAQGRIQQNDWVDKEGQKRTTVEVTVDEIGPSLKWATAQVTRVESGGGRAPAPAPWDSGPPQPGGQQPQAGWATPGSQPPARYSGEQPF